MLGLYPEPAPVPPNTWWRAVGLCKGESGTGRARTAELYPVCTWIKSCFYFLRTLRTANLLRMLQRSFFFLLVFYCNLA